MSSSDFSDVISKGAWSPRSQGPCSYSHSGFTLCWPTPHTPSLLLLTLLELGQASFLDPPKTKSFRVQTK